MKNFWIGYIAGTIALVMALILGGSMIKNDKVNNTTWDTC